MKHLLHTIRMYVLIGSVALSLGLYVLITTTVSAGLSRVAILVEYYGLISLIYTYFTLLAGPFCYQFRLFPFRGLYIKSRRALGVGAFYFAFLHTTISLFGQLGGFAGLGFLSADYLVAVILGFIALFIFSLLAITSFDYAVKKLSFPRWKLLHRFIYLAGILILVHTLMLGTHFTTLSDVIPQVTFVALVFLLFLEAPRLDKLMEKIMPIPHFGLSFVLIGIISGSVFLTMVYPVISSSNGGVSFDIHAAHKELAKQALQLTTQNTPSADTLGKSNLTIPGLSGDRTKRYTVSLSSEPDNPLPNQDVAIHFTIYDADSGNKALLFKLLYSKPMHFIIVNSDLTYFRHIHPTEDDKGVFSITTQFPKDDVYHLYIEFWPFGGIEQQVGFTLPVGNVPSHIQFSKATPDTNKAKTFGAYTVSMDTHGGLNAQAMTLGQQTMSISLKDVKTGKPITNLKPYLDSFGHLTMINEKTFDFIHVHPYNLTPPPPNANGGPTVDFLPIGIYGPFKPGIYRAFAEFNPDNNLFTADFTLKIN